MRQILITLFFIISFAHLLEAQTDSVYTGDKPPVSMEHPKKPNRDWAEKVTFGGNFQAYFGNPTFIYISPSIGYLLQKNLNVGIGFIYNYTKVDYGTYGKYSQSIYGGHSYARYNVTPSFFIQGQYDKLLQPDFYNFYNQKKKIWIDYVMAGVGYSQPLGELLVLNTSLMYNFTHSPKYSIYPTPLIFQIGVVGRLRSSQ